MKDRFMKNGVFSLEYDKETLRDIVLELQEENKKQKEVIDKLSKIIYEIDNLRKTTGGYPSHYLDKLLDILDEVKQWIKK